MKAAFLLLLGGAAAAPVQELRATEAVQPMNITGTAELANNFGDTCAVENFKCKTDSDCRSGEQGGTCGCYYTADTTGIGPYHPCEGAYFSEVQVGPIGHCTCKPKKYPYPHACHSNTDCMSGHCNFFGLGNVNGCSPD